MSDGDDDRTLLARHATGDRDAFAELVARHRDRLWRVALRTLGDPDDAADAVQDALLSAYRAAGSFRGDSAVTTWLHRIVVNAALDVARRRGKRDAAPLSAVANEPVDRAASGVYDDADTASAVIGALRQLPLEQAAALVLVDIEGFSVHDAAEVLQVPEGTVKSRCARARARLAGLLSDLAPELRNPGEQLPVQRFDASTPPTDGDTTS